MQNKTRISTILSQYTRFALSLANTQLGDRGDCLGALFFWLSLWSYAVLYKSFTLLSLQLNLAGDYLCGEKCWKWIFLIIICFKRCSWKTIQRSPEDHPRLCEDRWCICVWRAHIWMKQWEKPSIIQCHVKMSEI